MDLLVIRNMTHVALKAILFDFYCMLNMPTYNGPVGYKKLSACTSIAEYAY